MKIAVLSQKGGAGKSTIALGIASGLAFQGRNVLLVDSDPQGTLTAWSAHRKSVGLAPVEGLDVQQHAGADVHNWLRTLPDYDDVIIDGPPRADEPLSRSVIAAATDAVLIPLQASLADLWAARATVSLIREGWKKGLKNKAAFVLSRLKPGTNIGREFAEVLQSEGLPLLPAGTHDRTAYPAALSRCQTVFEYEPPSGKTRHELATLLSAVQELTNQ